MSLQRETGLSGTYAILMDETEVGPCSLALASYGGGGGLWALSHFHRNQYQSRSQRYLTLNHTAGSSCNSGVSAIVSGQSEDLNVRSYKERRLWTGGARGDRRGLLLAVVGLLGPPCAWGGPAMCGLIGGNRGQGARKTLTPPSRQYLPQLFSKSQTSLVLRAGSV